ncbi:MAG: NTP transferase domain-containing protein [Bacteroidia bacterium]|jgi:CTP:molybdopterin cytidylyltransferase MocA|nr:NTP transferase domain-containing protein [Bacteroidia bacterium]
MRGKNASVLILAGGKSLRMGYPKPYLPKSGTTLLNSIIRLYESCGFDNITVVLNKEFSEGVWADKYKKTVEAAHIILNGNAELGRSHSIGLGLAANSDTPYCFIQNIDTVLKKTEAIEKIWDKRAMSDYICPVYQGRRGHPVLLSGKIIKNIIRLEGEPYILKELLLSYQAAEVKVSDSGVLTNINTRYDYSKIVAV